MKQEKDYIAEATTFLSGKAEYQLVNFILLYLAAYAAKYLIIQEWVEPVHDLAKLKQELSAKINQGLYQNLHTEDPDLLRTLDWLKKNPPLETKEDILGEVYLFFSQKKHRKELGEHYTDTGLVSLIVDQVGEVEFSSQKVIDPACGSGNFLIKILRCAMQNEVKEQVAEKMYAGDFITGVDLQVIPCIITGVRILMELLCAQVTLKPTQPLPVYQEDSLRNVHVSLAEQQYDLVITNPPYLRYQRIPKADRDDYRARYESATGHFDLYILFIEKCIRLSKDAGKVIILTSDKFMVSSYGRGVRQYIKSIARLDQVYDLSKVPAFEAAVLSAVYFFSKAEQGNKQPRLCVVQQKKQVLSAEVTGHVNMAEQWRYSCLKEDGLLAKIYNISGITRLKDLNCRVSIGIQTTADPVFCRPLENREFETAGVEEELIFPLLRGKDLKKWCGAVPKNKILYPYMFDGKQTQRIQLKEYPHAERYLKSHKQELEERDYIKKLNKEWFEPLSPKSFELMRSIKILTPDLASNCKFSLDTKGDLCNGTIYFIQYREQCSLEAYKYLLAILNSSVINFAHKSLTTVYLASQKYRFQTQHMNQYPVLLIPEASTTFQEIVALVDQLLVCNEEDLTRYENQLDELIFDLYGLTNEERRIVRSALT